MWSHSARNAPPGSMVLKVPPRTTDALNSANSRIVYTLADASQFTVDAESGVIRTSQKDTMPRSKCPNGGDCPRTCVLTVEGRDCELPLDRTGLCLHHADGRK
ncbi:hypothetical protein BV898_04696 [Hypsibius exemplaris]|uniref:Cadherin domain-containing protein n=1 Tax=Hypsibius exemplaris TaxID=2072580 RepID=A0A1W0X2D2_HYPEX|nr:hypothetical protein BV898_04696 [Hypsibius exemplaris]